MIRRTTFCESPARGGIDDHHVGAFRLLDQLAQREPDVAGEEPGVVDLVEPSVGDRVGDRVLDDLEPPHLRRPRRHQQPDRPDPAVQVVDALEAAQAARSSIATAYSRSAISVLVWKNACGRDREAHPAELLVEPVRAREQLGLAALGRSRRRASIRVHSRPSAAAGAATSASRSSFAGARHEPDLELAGAAALPDDEVAQQALAGAPVVRRRARLAGTSATISLARRVARLGGEQAVGDLDDLVPAAWGVEAAHELSVPGRRRTSTRACCGSATARRRARSARACTRPAGRSGAARRRPAPA